MWGEVLYSLVTLRKKPPARTVRTPIQYSSSTVGPDPTLKCSRPPTTTLRVYFLLDQRQGIRILANTAECKSEDPPAGLQHAMIGIGRSAYEPPRAADECGGEPRAPEDGLHRASGADARLRGSARGKTSCVGREPQGSLGPRLSLILNRFPLDTLCAITTRPEARSRHTPRSAAREVLGYQRGTPARLRAYSLLRYFQLLGYLVLCDR
jgi:hypothetical protein